MQNKKNIFTIIVFSISILLILSRCSFNNDKNIDNKILTGTNVEKNNEVKNIKKVSISKVFQLRSIEQDIKIPATIVAKNDVLITSKVSGTIKNMYVNIGDKVSKDQIIAEIDENNNPIYISYLQAQKSYELALQNYQNLKNTIPYELNQIDISKKQSKTAKENTLNITSENIKSSEIAYNAAKLAVEQAKLNLENNKKTFEQNIENTEKNVSTLCDNVFPLSSNIINTINSITGLDENIKVNIPYLELLGAQNSSTKADAKKKYYNAIELYNYLKNKKFSSINEKYNDILNLINTTSIFAESAKNLFENTPPSQYLPYNSTTPGGISISGYISNINNFISQLENTKNQLNLTMQTYQNTKLSAQTQLDSLQKAYESALIQEKNAYQALNNAKANIKSQNDNSFYNVLSTENQYETTKTKLEAQLNVYKTQLDIAEIQLKNAQIAYDNLKIKSSIDGFITQKLASIGDNLNINSPIYRISQSDNKKLQFYVNADILPYLYVGMPINIEETNEKIYIKNISTQANNAKKYLVEADLPNNNNLNEGIILNISFKINKKSNNGIYLPINAIIISSENKDYDGYIYKVIENNKVKKWYVKIDKIEGDMAYIHDKFNDDEKIVIKGTQLLTDKDYVEYE